MSLPPKTTWLSGRSRRSVERSGVGAGLSFIHHSRYSADPYRRSDATGRGLVDTSRRGARRGANDRLIAVALPLEGIVVVDLTQNVAGPFCTQILGDMGADVIKVERPGRGDDARAWAPPYWGDESATFMSFNRNKRSIAIDLKRDGGLEIVRRLVKRGDVFVQSLHAGAAEARGLGFAGAVALNPRIVYCSVTAFGARGPLRDYPGYDALMQAYGGLMSVNGHPGQEPARVGTSIVDMGTAMWAALGVVAALRQRDATQRAV